MTDRDIKNRWINTGIIVGNNSQAKILCPECQATYLQITDVMNDALPKQVIGRLMMCPECGAFNELRLDRTIDN